MVVGKRCFAGWTVTALAVRFSLFLVGDAVEGQVDLIDRQRRRRLFRGEQQEEQYGDAQ